MRTATLSKIETPPTVREATKPRVIQEGDSVYLDTSLDGVPEADDWADEAATVISRPDYHTDPADGQEHGPYCDIEFSNDEDTEIFRDVHVDYLWHV